MSDDTTRINRLLEIFGRAANRAGWWGHIRLSTKGTDESIHYHEKAKAERNEVHEAILAEVRALEDERNRLRAELERGKRGWTDGYNAALNEVASRGMAVRAGPVNMEICIDIMVKQRPLSGNSQE